MQAFGLDRLRVSDDGRVFLSSRVPKEWRARSVRAASSIPHPGTAVLWDEVFYEVVRETPLPNGGVRYELAPFPDDLLMRDSVAYDEASEVARSAHRHDTKRREHSRKILNALAPITGHAPAAVQEWMHLEIGTPPSALTGISAIPLIIFAAVSIRWMVNMRMDGAPLPVPKFVLLLGLYLGLESVVRLYSAVGLGRPIGSVPGLVVYALAHRFFLRRTVLPSAFTPARGTATLHTAPSDDVALQDALMIREPFLTLLAVSDQQKLAARYGFSPLRYGRKTATVILVVSAVGSFTSVSGLLQGHGLSSFVSLVLSAWLAIEQVVRWPALTSTGAPSILRFVVRPLAGKLLD